MILDLFNYSVIPIFLAGAVGAFVSDILKDNYLELPKKLDKKIYLGSIGGIIIGGFAGALIDGSLTTAFMGGFVGKEIILKLIKKNGIN